jgi:hypothetical protein
LQAKKNVLHWEGKRKKLENELAEHKQKQEVLETEFEVGPKLLELSRISKFCALNQDWTRLTSSNWERVEKPRSQAVLLKEQDKLEKQIKMGDEAWEPLLPSCVILIYLRQTWIHTRTGSSRTP